MKIRWYHILVTVLLTGTVAISVYTYTQSKPVNSTVRVVLDSPTPEIEEEIILEDKIDIDWNLEENKTSFFGFQFLNRDLPSNWNDKSLYLKYTYLGEYKKGLETEIDDLLGNEYSWKNQLDEEGDVVFNGPFIKKDGIYQLYVHNSLYLAQKYFLLGDVLHYLSNNEDLIGTQIEVRNLIFEAVWEEEIDVLKNPSLKDTADLIISTCLERNGSKRLVVGFDIK